MAQQFTGRKITAELNDKDATEEKNSYSHGLPPELLSKIFILAVPTRNIVTDMDFPAEVPDYKTTFAISQACNYWREVALITPQIWASISVVRPDQMVSTGLVALTRTFIERSKSSPLHITIYIGDEMEKERKDSWITTLLLLIFSQAYRWKSAIIRFEGYDFGDFPQLDLPILESLSYKRPSGFQRSPTPVTLFKFRHAPSLRHAILDGPGSQIRLPWSQILNYIGRPVDLEILRPIRSQLQTCGFRGALSGSIFGIRVPSSPIVFSKLTSLQLIDYAPFTHSLLGWIVTPVLENLEIRSRSMLEASLIIDPLLARTLTSPSTTLRSLTFHVRGMTAQSLARLLYSTPCLTSLDICDTPASVFACLGARPSNHFTAPLVPRLRSLIIHNFSHSDAAALLCIYDSRHPLLNTARDDMGLAHLDITLSYRSFRACHWAQYRIAEGGGMDMKALGKTLGWCSHLVKQFIIEKREKYAVLCTNKSFWSRRVYYPSQLNIFFSQVLEIHQFSDPTIIEISKIAKILSDIKDLPPTAILGDDDYHFRQRAEKLLKGWAPLLEDVRSHQRWSLSEDHLKLMVCSPIAISSREHGY